MEFTVPITKQLHISIVPPKAAQKSAKVASWDQGKLDISQNREAERIRRRAAKDRQFWSYIFWRSHQAARGASENNGLNNVTQKVVDGSS